MHLVRTAVLLLLACWLTTACTPGFLALRVVNETGERIEAETYCGAEPTGRVLLPPGAEGQVYEERDFSEFLGFGH